MSIKKKIILGCALTVLSLPICAASLDTYNWTDEDSSVSIKSASGTTCSGSLGKYTPKRTPAGPGHLSTSEGEVRLLCGQIMGNVNCSATMYNTSNCGGDKVAEATLEIKKIGGASSMTTTITQQYGNRYDIQANGARVDIKYRGKK